METNEDGESSSSSTPRYRPDGIEALCAATGTYCTYALYHHIIINILWLLASTCCQISIRKLLACHLIQCVKTRFTFIISGFSRKELQLMYRSFKQVTIDFVLLQLKAHFIECSNPFSSNLMTSMFTFTFLKEKLTIAQLPVVINLLPSSHN